MINFCLNHPKNPAAVSPEWILACVEKKEIVNVVDYPPKRHVNTVQVRKKSHTIPEKQNVKSSIFQGRFFHIANSQHESNTNTTIDHDNNILCNYDKVERLIVSHGGRILSKEGIRILQKTIPNPTSSSFSSLESKADSKSQNQSQNQSHERICYIIQHLGGVFDLERIKNSDALIHHISQRNLCMLVPANAIWLQTCDVAMEEVPPSQYEKLFMPQPQPITRLKRGVKVNVSVTGFVGVERIGLRMMLLAIGADYTENMSRDNTHLICREASGPKYEKAIEWKLHVVTVEWLYHIAYFGHDTGCEKSFGVTNRLDESSMDHDTIIQSSQEY